MSKEVTRLSDKFQWNLEKNMTGLNNFVAQHLDWSPRKIAFPWLRTRKNGRFTGCVRIHPSRAVRLERHYAVSINRMTDLSFGRKGLLLIAMPVGSDYVEQSTLITVGRLLHEEHVLEMYVLITTPQSAWLEESHAYVISPDHPLVTMARQSEACGQNYIGIQDESGNLDWVLTNDEAQAWLKVHGGR